MFTLTFSSYSLSCTTGGLPSLYGEYRRHARIVSEFDLNEPKETDDSESPCFVGVSQSGTNDDWSFLVVAQTFSPANGGFYPGALLLPDTEILLLGAGTRLLAYGFNPPRLLWEETADFGFWGWERHGDTVIMAAELEIAAWNIHGQKLWSQYVEPPWSYTVEGSTLWIDQEGTVSSLTLATGQAT